MSITLRDYTYDESGAPITANITIRRKSDNVIPTGGTTTSNGVGDGKWEAVLPDLAAGDNYYVEIVAGASRRWIRGDSSPPQSFDTPQIANLAITTPKIADANVTRAKLEANERFPIGGIVPYAGPSVIDPGWLLCDGSSLLRTGTYANLFAAITTTWGAVDGTHFSLPNLKGQFLVGFDAGQPEFNHFGGSGGEKAHTLSIAELPVHGHGPGNLGGSTSGESGHTHPVQPTGAVSVETVPHVHAVDPPSTQSSDDGLHQHGHDGVNSTVFVGPSTGSNNVALAGSSGTTFDGTHHHVTDIAPFSSGGGSHAHPLILNLVNTSPGSGHTHPVSITGGVTDTTGSGNSHNNLPPYVTLHYIIRAI